VRQRGSLTFIRKYEYGFLKVEGEAANDHELTRIVYKLAPIRAIRGWKGRLAGF
jgi:hypothetical protein